MQPHPGRPLRLRLGAAHDIGALKVDQVSEIMKKIAVIGFGYIGSVIAAVLAHRGYSVAGIDSNRSVIDAIQAGRCPIPEPGLAELLAQGLASGRLEVGTEAAAAADADVVLITVGTPLSADMQADLGHIRAACEALAPYVRDEQIIMIKSTVPPGVTRLMHDEVLAPRARVRVAFSPERLAEGKAIHEFERLPIVVGGVDAEATAAAAEFWRSALPVEVLEVSSPEAAELVKLADNLWIDVNVALANELAKLADVLPYPIDVLEVIRGANSLKKGQHYVNILQPSNGVGGYCLTKDPWFVDAIARRAGLQLELPGAGRRANDSMPEHVFGRVDAFLRGRGLSPAEARIGVLGFSFKTNSGDCRFTPVAPLVRHLREAGYGPGLRICDPMVSAAEAAEHGIDLEPDWESAVENATAVLFLTGHDEFAAISTEALAARVAPGALVYDGRIYFDRARMAEISAAGLTYMGVGR